MDKNVFGTFWKEFGKEEKNSNQCVSNWMDYGKLIWVNRHNETNDLLVKTNKREFIGLTCMDNGQWSRVGCKFLGN